MTAVVVLCSALNASAEPKLALGSVEAIQGQTASLRLSLSGGTDHSGDHTFTTFSDVLKYIILKKEQ